MKTVTIPATSGDATLKFGSQLVKLTNLGKIFWKNLGLTKRDLLQHYADVSKWLLPHIVDRAMVMKRYPNGAEGDFFYMKRIPLPHPEWVKTCSIEHGSGSIIDFPMVQDVASLLWVVNLGCIDLNPLYGRCDDPYRPDFLHFDLDPFEGATFDEVLETARILKRALDTLALPSFVKTSGSSGIHVLLPLGRQVSYEQSQLIGELISRVIVREHPRISTIERVIKKRGRKVYLDYMQNGHGQLLVAPYTVRPLPGAPVSMPLEWSEVNQDLRMGDWTIKTVPQRQFEVGRELRKRIRQALDKNGIPVPFPERVVAVRQGAGTP